MKTKKFIFRWLLFTIILCCCSAFIKLSFDEKTPSLSRENVEALADWEEDFQIVTKFCSDGGGWCIYNGTEFWGIVYVEK